MEQLPIEIIRVIYGKLYNQIPLHITSKMLYDSTPTPAPLSVVDLVREYVEAGNLERVRFALHNPRQINVEIVARLLILAERSLRHNVSGFLLSEYGCQWLYLRLMHLAIKERDVSILRRLPPHVDERLIQNSSVWWELVLAGCVPLVDRFRALGLISTATYLIIVGMIEEKRLRGEDAGGQ
jgi:hypothetical protein